MSSKDVSQLAEEYSLRKSIHGDLNVELNTKMAYTAGWKARDNEVNKLIKECEMWEACAKSWMEDYDKIKIKYEPTIVIYD